MEIKVGIFRLRQREVRDGRLKNCSDSMGRL